MGAGLEKVMIASFHDIVHVNDIVALKKKKPEIEENFPILIKNILVKTLIIRKT